VYGRRSNAGPPHAVGVCHFDAAADDVANYLCAPANMAAWDSELCERSKVRERRAATPAMRAAGCASARVRALQFARTPPARHARAADDLLASTSPADPARFLQVLKQLNPDAALGYLEYYGEEALGFSIVAPRVRCVRRRLRANRQAHRTVH
jgi:hypothetical protein